MASKAEIAVSKSRLIDALADGMPLAVAAEIAGVRMHTVTKWRATDAAFATEFRETVETAATGYVDIKAIADRAHALATTGHPVMLQFMLKAHLPHIYCDKARTLRIIDEQARAAAQTAAETGTSDSANLILMHLTKLASMKAGIVSADGNG